MADPWLSIIGLGEDGPDGLASASRAALDAAEWIIGAPRHLALAGAGARGVEWPVPFSLAPVLERRGQRVAVLASGDPFWHGAGGSLAQHLSPGEWRAYPAASIFSLAMARLGWRIEDSICLGLHAAPLAQLRPHLAPGRRLVVTLRDAAAAGELARWLVVQGFGESRLWLLEALGGQRERIRETTAAGFDAADIRTPVAAAIEARGGPGLATTPGRPNDLFDHDGQITKAPVRALTLAALAPRAGECLWDIGTGSGAISIEWLLAAPDTRAAAIEADPARAARARANAARFGIGDLYQVTEARAPEGLADLPRPQAVFIGGGASAALFEALWPRLPEGTRLVVNAVTLETEALLSQLSETHGGSLLRLDLAEARPLGRKRGWAPARPLVQWSVMR